MAIGWIYAFRDRGFELGVKIGRDKNHPDRYRRAQCYTPRGIDLVASWRINNEFDSLAQAEALARRGLPKVTASNSGAEWCALTPKEAVERVSENLAIAPESHIGNPRITTTYDDFRDPKALGSESHRQIFWIYQENVTSLLKVQRTCSWKVPQEPVKTYSLLGFRPVASFGHFAERDVKEGNRKIHELWEELVAASGHGVNPIQVGWLNAAANLEQLRRAALGRGLTEITDWQRCPPGVRPGY